MNKSLYQFGIFFLGLTVGCGLLQNTDRFLFGLQLYNEPSIFAWVLVANLVSVTAAIVMLRYYHYRGYWPAFYTLILSTIASLCYVGIFLMMLLSKSPSGYYEPVVFIYLGANTIHALTLLFSGTRKKVWLRIAGAFMATINLVLILSVVLPLLFKLAPLTDNSVPGKILLCILIAGGLAPVPLIMNFRDELKLLNKANAGSAVDDPWEDRLILVKALALMTAVILGAMVTYQGFSAIYWGKQGYENAKKMAKLFESRTFVNSKGDTLFYHLLKPLNYDPKKKYPLVVNLPYGGLPGTDRTDKILQMDGAAAADILSTDGNRKKYPAFLFVPNCPPRSGWGGVPNYPSVDTLVYKAIIALDTVFSIDAKRRYVTGISRGGAGAWHFICTRPDLFAAAIPVSGSEDPKLAPKIVDVAVWAFHGAKDQNVRVARSRGMIEGMKRSGQKPKYTEYPNEGHNIWYQVSITPGLWDWLFAQKKD